MAYIGELIDSLFDNESEGNLESFKKLIYLAVNQTALLAPHALHLANTICPVLQAIDDSTTKIYALQLLAELATNYQSQIAAETYEFTQVVELLSDDNAEVRKAAHYLLLIFIKKYQRMDEIVRGYVQGVRENGERWKQIQKIIHSFQSLLVIEPKCVTYPHNYSHLDDFLRLLIAFRLHQHTLIQKASEQTISSFVKNEYTPQVVHRLDRVVQGELGQLAEKLGVHLAVAKIQSPPKSVHRSRKQTNQFEVLLEALQGESDWKVKCQIIEDISKRLQRECDEVPGELVEQMLDYTYDYNFKICITAMNIILTLTERHPNTTQNNIRKIEEIMVEKICDLKMAVRQIATKILKKIFNNSSKDSARRLLGKLANCSVIGKEEILTFFGDFFSVKVPFDLSMILGEVATQLSNQNTKIKIKTLDCLVRISLNGDTQECKYILGKKLNRVYYDMFLDRLKERNGEKDTNKWQEKNTTINKGATWQAERSPNMVQSANDRFMTKVEFGRKVQKTQEYEDFTYEAPTFGGMIEQHQPKSKGIMMGTSHSTHHTHSSNDNDETNRSKLSKKPLSDSYKPSTMVMSVESQVAEEKKLPLKPKPVKRGTVTHTSELQIEESSNNTLVIHSKEYKNRTSGEEEKGVKQMKLTRRKQPAREKMEKVEKQEEEQKVSTKQPFSIKKSTSRKDHQIDYKATQYLAKDELAPVSNPKELLKEVLQGLPNSNDWSRQFDCLDGIRRLIKHHQDFYPQLHQNLATIMPEVLKLVESLRSSLAKNAMIALSEMCQALKKGMDPFLEGIFTRLFKKAQDTNTFIIEEVNKCIRSLCSYCSPVKITGIVANHSQSKAIPIKVKVVFCVDRLLSKGNYSLALLKQNPKLLAIMSGYIADGSQEVRGQTRDIFINIQSNNPVYQVEGMFRKTNNWEKWRSILEKDHR